jgi:DNA polymerase-3 subunit epsilon
VNIDQAAQLLSTSPDHRVLRRVPPVEQWQFPEPVSDVVTACVIDCETTGLESTDEVMELGIVPFDYCKTAGRVTAVHTRQMLSAFRQPNVPVSEEAQQLTGITPEMVAGQSITQETVECTLNGVQLVIAHNAGFDRPKCEQHWEVFQHLPWACSIEDVPWKKLGMPSNALEVLLLKQGYFYAGHRAADDALATLFLLSLRDDRGDSFLGALLDRARKPTYLIRAIDTVFEERWALSRHGYRWDDGSKGRGKAWVLSTADVTTEVEWLKASAAFGPRTWIETVKVSPLTRFSGRT